jgi:heat shock protein 90kDa beta
LRVGPSGQVYYHNVQTQESTYIRPLPAIPVLQAPQPAKKKEKPLIKTPIPGTDWLRVKTTEGNIFYSNKSKKESVWTIPPEISDAVAVWEQSEREYEEMEAKAKEKEKDDEAEREIQRIKSEVQAMAKRKAEDVVPVEEFVNVKRARTDDEAESDEGMDGEEESEEEEWQRDAAAQLAAEAEEEKKREEEEKKRMKDEAEAESRKAKEALQLNIPAKVDLSLDEAKALFKVCAFTWGLIILPVSVSSLPQTLLREKDINPLHPWDTCLPLFVSDPRYILLPSVSARREAFDEYCRDRSREIRRSALKKELDAATPQQEFELLLSEEVKSTRMTWSDFRRAWKKDRRFWGWGRDDREREKKFREFIRELGESESISFMHFNRHLIR